MNIEFKEQYSQYLLLIAKLQPSTEGQYRSYLKHLSEWTNIDITIQNALAAKEPLIWHRLEAKIEDIDGGVKTITNWRSAWRQYERFAQWKLEQDAREVVDEEGNPDSDAEARRRIWVSIIRRQGQTKFRNKLLMAYRNTCAVTGCQDEDVLEAAHVRPYSANGQNDISNGILLRSDIHTLFDKYLLTIEHGTWSILCADSLSKVYRQYHGKTATMPAKTSECPEQSALEERLFIFDNAQ